MKKWIIILLCFMLIGCFETKDNNSVEKSDVEIVHRDLDLILKPILDGGLPPLEEDIDYMRMSRETGAAAISYPQNTSPLTTDELLGMDDPAGTWAINRFPISNLLGLTEATDIDASVSNTEYGYLDGVSGALQTQLNAKEGTLTNSAGLLAALSDETGTGLSVFNDSPTLITPVLGVATATSLTITPSANPTIELHDSDGLGADKYAADMNANFTTVTDGAEVSDVTINYQDAGTKTAAIIIDGSDNQVELQINTTLQTGDIVNAEIADDTILEAKLDATNAPTDNDLLSYDLATTGFTWVAAAGGGDLLADGSVPLTANWDVGAFTITALTFTSDQATGTAPFTVASTTVVTNLNADTVDGESASAIVTSARVGTSSANLDDTDASIEWEDATALTSTGDLDTDTVDDTHINWTSITYLGEEGQPTSAGVGLASPTLDDTDASVEWEDAADLESNGALSADTVAPAEMADADHGDVAWSSGVATVQAVSGANAVDSDAYVDGSIDFVHLAADAKFQSFAVAGLGDTTTPSVLTTAETTNKCISNYKASGADHVFTMPAAHAAGNVIFSIGDEFQVDIEPNTGDLFYLNGTAMAANEHIQNTADTLGERIVGYCVNINGTLRWMFYTSDAAWVEETP